MPKGPKGQKRPADVIGNAVKVDADLDLARKRKTSAPTTARTRPRSHSDSEGGKARAAKLTEKRKKEIAQRAAAARWRTTKS